MHLRPPDSLWRFFAATLLLLPLWFAVLFLGADAMLWPAVAAAAAILNALHPGLIESVEGSVRALDVVTGIGVELPEGAAQLVVNVNLMSYAWNLPVLFALLFAAPRRFFSAWKLLIAYLGVLPLYCWGMCFDVLKTAALQSGPQAREFLGYAGLELEFIGLAYQFGYLMLPVIGAVALWIGMSRDMLFVPPERREPEADGGSAEEKESGSPLLRSPRPTRRAEG